MGIGEEMKRFTFWKTENAWSGLCPAYMSENTSGEYVRYKDVAPLIQHHERLNRKAIALGYPDIDALLICFKKPEEPQIDHTGD